MLLKDIPEIKDNWEKVCNFFYTFNGILEQKDGVKKRPLSERAIAIQDYIANGDFSSEQQRSLCNIFSIFLQETLKPKPTKDSYMAFGFIVVPINNVNGHDYQINYPVAVLRNNDDYGLKVEGIIGNHLALHKREKAVRLAIKEEIDLYLNTVKIIEDNRYSTLWLNQLRNEIGV